MWEVMHDKFEPVLRVSLLPNVVTSSIAEFEASTTFYTLYHPSVYPYLT